MIFEEDTTLARVPLKGNWKNDLPHLKKIDEFREFANSSVEWWGNCKGCTWGNYRQVWFVVRARENTIAFRVAKVLRTFD